MKLFVSDIDGTLYWYDNKNNNKCSNACKKSIKRWLDAGNIFALATARTHIVYDSIIDDLGLPIDYIGGNGAEIVYKDGIKDIHYVPISLFLEVNNWLEENDVDATVKICIEGKFIALHNDKYPFNYLTRMRKNLANAEILTKEDCTNFVKGYNMSIICNPKSVNYVAEMMQKMHGNNASIIANDIDNIDFMPLNINKGKGVTILADRYHIAKDDIIVIGDDRNDIAMFDIAGKSYAMEHSDVDVKRHADYEVDLIEDAIYRELRG